ncbi:MAG: FAD:protein FMN transferase [Chloroflexi bacterium]|nr:MAG: FAD:protein FMN transferase [Chloroflexota bacterium]
MTTTLLGIVDDRALGTDMRVIVTRPDRLAEAKAAADDVIKAIDAAASRFRDDSELSRINREPGRRIAVSPLMARALAAGLRGARLTGGAVDPTVGSAVRLAGYDRDFAAIPADGSPITVSVTRVPGWRAIEFDEADRTVCVMQGVEIDLGATAKALASDLAAAAALEAVGSGGVLVSLGGDIALAGDAPAGGWAVQTSEDSGAPLDESEETITIQSGGIATSSITVRRWSRGGVVLHHIIDPATGAPASGPWRTASVVAGSCVDANIAATAAIVMGEAAIAWLAANKLPARLVDRDGIVHRLAGWPAPRH